MSAKHHFIFLILLLVIFSCKKDSSVANNSQDISSSNVGGKLTKITITNSTHSDSFFYFLYYQNDRISRALVRGNNPDTFAETILTRNANGMIIKSIYSEYESSTQPKTQNIFNCNIDPSNQFHYNSIVYSSTPVECGANGIENITYSGDLVVNRNYIDNITPASCNYLIVYNHDSNGNIIRDGSTRGSSTSSKIGTFFFDNKSPAFQSGFKYDESFMYQFQKNNLTKEIYSNGDTTTYNYSYNSFNRPSSAVVTEISRGNRDVSYWKFYYE